MSPPALPRIDSTLCDLCGDCLDACPIGALTMGGRALYIDAKSCRYCGDCEDVCPRGAISLSYEVVIVKNTDP